MKTEHRKILQKIFAAEISGSLPWQGKSKYLPEMEEEQLIERVAINLPGPYLVTVSGYALTPSGRFLYCQGCK